MKEEEFDEESFDEDDDGFLDELPFDDD